MTTDAYEIAEEILDDKLFIVCTPIGYTVYSEDLEGEQVSGGYNAAVTAEAFIAGYKAGLLRALERLT